MNFPNWKATKFIYTQIKLPQQFTSRMTHDASHAFHFNRWNCSNQHTNLTHAKYVYTHTTILSHWNQTSYHWTLFEQCINVFLYNNNCNEYSHEYERHITMNFQFMWLLKEKFILAVCSGFVYKNVLVLRFVNVCVCVCVYDYSSYTFVLVCSHSNMTYVKEYSFVWALQNARSPTTHERNTRSNEKRQTKDREERRTRKKKSKSYLTYVWV